MQQGNKIKKSKIQIQQPQQQGQLNHKSVQKSSINKADQQRSIISNQKHENNENLLDITAQHELIQKRVQKRKQYQKFLQNRVITIEGPQLVTENVIKSYKLYKIKSRKKDEEQFDTSVSRRFSDFEYLQKQLVQNYGGCIIPLLPEKNVWANVNMQGKQQIQNRIKGLQKYLKSLLNHSKLRMTDELNSFLFEKQIKFSQKKGEYFSKVKTEQKIKQIASNAYSIGKGLFSKYITGSYVKQQQNIQLMKPSKEDLKIMQYQRQVSDLIKVINLLRKVCQNSVIQMKSIGLLIPDSAESKFECNNILTQFEDLCKYIFSCNQALARRNQIRLEKDFYTAQLQKMQKKVKTNPRSQQVDIIRNKLLKANEKCEKWTQQLLEELQQSISMGKSMIQGFINNYSQRKQKFYDL